MGFLVVLLWLASFHGLPGRCEKSLTKKLALNEISFHLCSGLMAMDICCMLELRGSANTTFGMTSSRVLENLQLKESLMCARAIASE